MDSNAEMHIGSPEPAVEPVATPTEAPPVAVIPRAVFNYFVIAVVALALGLVLGVVGYDRVVQQSRADTEALIEKTVATAVAALPRDTVADVPDPNQRHEVSIANQPYRGADDAPIVIVEFGDFSCGYCKRFNDQTVTPLMETYGDQVKLVYRDYPILGPNSLSAALAAECAHDQDAFWGFHDRLYADPSNLTRDAFIAYATELELELDQFAQCYDDQVHRDAVVQDYNDGQALGVGGTPTFFINGKILVGAQPYDQFVSVIEAELDELAVSQAS